MPSPLPPSCLPSWAAGDESNPSVAGIQNILSAYYSSLANVTLSGHHPPPLLTLPPASHSLLLLSHRPHTLLKSDQQNHRAHQR
jgi:hypothetical protein